MTEAGKEAADRRIRITRGVIEPWLALIIGPEDYNLQKKDS